MTQPFVTGPVRLFVGLDGIQGTPSLLGWGEEAPEIDHRPQFEPVMCDLTGTRIPMDVADENEDAIIAVNLVRWDEAVLSAIQARPFLAPRGSRLPTDLGTLYLTEGAAFPLWAHFPYGGGNPGGKTSYASQPAGYRYFGAYLLGPDSLRKNGTRARVVQTIFHALPVIVSNQFLFPSGGTVLTGGTITFDHDMSAVKNLPLS